MALPSTRISVPLLSGSSPSSWARGIGQGEAWRREKSTPGKGKAWQEGGCGAWLWTGWIWGASWSTTGRWVKQVWTLREEVGTERFSPLPGRIFSLIHYFFPCPTSPVHTKSTSPNIRILTNLLTHATSHPSDNTRLLTQAQVWIVTPPSLETWNSIFPVCSSQSKFLSLVSKPPTLPPITTPLYADAPLGHLNSQPSLTFLALFSSFSTPHHSLQVHLWNLHTANSTPNLLSSQILQPLLPKLTAVCRYWRVCFPPAWPVISVQSAGIAKAWPLSHQLGATR